MRLPNFLVVGAAKAGTTALYEYLKQHPQIFMSPNKEPNFFALEGERLDFRGPHDPVGRWSVTEIDTYSSLFTSVSDERAIGEASILYLYSPKAPERIAHYIPDVKMIAILRNPVDRAYATFCYLSEAAREPFHDFAEALQAEEARISAQWEHIWHYKQMGFYAAQLKRYLQRFDRSQMKIYLYEDFKKNNVAVLQDIFQFLDVDPSFVPDTSLKYHVSGIPKNRTLHKLIVKTTPLRAMLKPYTPVSLRLLFIRLRTRNLTKPPVAPQVRRQLVDEYRSDILELQDLLQRDLSNWLE